MNSRFAAALVAALGLAGAAAAKPSTKINWVKTAESSGYEQATATAPDFGNKSVWPLTGNERFLEQQWPAGRLLVWAHPGQSANVKSRQAKLNAYDLKNWVDVATGKQPTRGLDENTDVLLPASETPYVVSWKKAGVEHAPVTIRHLTVGRNARWYSSGLRLHGSIWLKRGGGMGNHGSLSPIGKTHSFFRNDNGDPSARLRSDETGVSQYISFNKPGGSCEFLGAFSTGDEFKLYAGSLIIGSDSRVMPGRNATPFIEGAGTLVLLDGAAFAKWCNQLAVIDLRVSGTLQGGLPERPLTRDAFVGVSYQNTNATKFYDNGLLSPPRNRSLESRTVPLLFAQGARLRTYSPDLEKASLVIGWHGIDAKKWHADGVGVSFRRMDPKAQNYLVQQLDKLPKGVTAAFQPGVELNGVRFDHFLEGGILLLDPAAPKAWKNVSYGPHNQAEPKRLLRAVKRVDFRRGSYED